VNFSGSIFAIYIVQLSGECPKVWTSQERARLPSDAIMTTTTDDGIKAGSQSSTNTPAQSVDPNRRKHPCVLCQQRKVMCDRDEPCGNCSKAHVPCVSSAMLPPKRRKKRFPEAELLAKLRRYEEHLRRYGADIDAINNETQPMHVAPPKNNDNPWVEVPAPQAHPRADAIRSLAIRRSLKNVKKYVKDGALRLAYANHKQQSIRRS